MTEDTFRLKMPTVSVRTEDSAPRPLICFKDDSGRPAIYFGWQTRCQQERHKNIKPDASPAMPVIE